MKNTHSPVRAAALALALPLFLAACGGGSPSSPTAMGTLEAQSAIVAAAAPSSCSYSHVWVTVTAVRVLRDDAGAQRWQDISLTAARRIDLLSPGGVLQALGVAPLQAGHYTQVRLVLGANGNTVQPAGGAETALKVPGGAASGLKLMGDITVQPGAVSDLALDGFDACTAIASTGKGSYNLKPEAPARMEPVAQAGPEVAGADGEVIPLPAGGWVLAAHSGTSWSLQHYGATGNATGSPAYVSIGSDIAPSFAALAGGGYAAVWLMQTSTLDVYQVTTQAWDTNGVALSPATNVALVNPGKLSHPPALPKIAALAGGGYVLVWGLPPSDDGVYAQRFTASGAAAAPAVRVVESGTGSLGAAALPAGGYVVTWGRLSSTSGGAQAFSAADVPLAAMQSAGSNGDGGGPPIPVVRALAGGGAVIAWQAVGQHLMMQQVAADGTPVTAAQIVDDLTASPIFASIAIGALPDGGSVIAWTQSGGVYARRYLASGAPAGPQTKINLVTTSAGTPVGVAVRADGSFEIHWTGLLPTETVRRTYVRTFPAGSLAG